MEGINMIRIVPEHMYKREFLEEGIEVCGYKSETFDYREGHDKPRRNNDMVSLSIRSKDDVGGQFTFTINGRDSLQKLKESIDFVRLTIVSATDKGGQFSFDVSGRNNLLKLKDVIDFALEIKEYKCVYCEDSGLATNVSVYNLGASCFHCRGEKNA